MLNLETRLLGLRDELRVVWQAIDELREWADHAMRNPPGPPPQPLRIWSLASDATAADFGERINAIPEEVMQLLRDELAAGKSQQQEDVPSASTLEDQPSQQESPRTAAQGQLF